MDDEEDKETQVLTLKRNEATKPSKERIRREINTETKKEKKKKGTLNKKE